MKKMLMKMASLVAGRRSFQPLFEFLFSASLYGMNYGNGDAFRTSGELYVLKYIKSKLTGVKKPYIFFDGGANSGHYSLNLADFFRDSNYLIYSFEPSQSAFDLLKKNTLNNQMIISNNIGLGSSDEIVTLYKPGDTSELSSVYNRQLDHYGIDLSHKESIQLKTVDNFSREYNISRINLLKLDIEGNEYQCLLGASNMLKNKKIDFIQFEFGGCNIDARTYFQDFWYLLKDDFIFYRIVRNGLVRINEYNERLEIFKNINFLLELKK